MQHVLLAIRLLQDHTQKIIMRKDEYCSRSFSETHGWVADASSMMLNHCITHRDCGLDKPRLHMGMRCYNS